MFLLTKYNWFYFIFMLINLIMFMCMNTFYSMWMMMELNLLIFLTLLILNNNFIMDKLMKYFLINSFSSMIYFCMLNLNFLLSNNFILILMNLCMIMKLGMFPFHLWFIDLMTNINWIMCFFLSSTQKIIPFMFILFYKNIKFLILISIFGGLMSLFMIFNQMLLKKIMGYSSINHLSWMIMSLIISIKLFLYYFISYMMINFLIMTKLYILNINQMMEFNNMMMFNKMYIMFMFFSLGGLPPFFGFSMKWFMIIQFSLNKIWMIMMMLIFYSLTFLYFYIRLFLNTLMINQTNLMVNFFNKSKLFNKKILLILNLMFMINLFLFFSFLIF